MGKKTTWATRQLLMSISVIIFSAVIMPVPQRDSLLIYSVNKMILPAVYSTTSHLFPGAKYASPQRALLLPTGTSALPMRAAAERRRVRTAVSEHTAPATWCGLSSVGNNPTCARTGR